jgi:hypothetical protein
VNNSNLCSCQAWGQIYPGEAIVICQRCGGAQPQFVPTSCLPTLPPLPVEDTVNGDIKTRRGRRERRQYSAY